MIKSFQKYHTIDKGSKILKVSKSINFGASLSYFHYYQVNSKLKIQSERMPFPKKTQVIAVYSHDYFTLSELREMVNDSMDYFWWACYFDKAKEQYCYIVQISNMIRVMSLRPNCAKLPDELCGEMNLIRRRWYGKRVLKTDFVYEYETVYCYGLKSAEMVEHYFDVVYKINNFVGIEVENRWRTEDYGPFVAKRFEDAWIVNEAPL